MVRLASFCASLLISPCLIFAWSLPAADDISFFSSSTARHNTVANVAARELALEATQRLDENTRCYETCFRNEANKPGLSCAFVSSAGSLLSSKLGRIVDSYDVVLRTAFAPTSGYEVYVGSRTTARFGYAMPVSPDLRFSGTERVVLIANILGDKSNKCPGYLARVRAYQRSTGQKPTPVRCFLVSLDESKKVPNPDWPQAGFSSGMWSMAALAQVCDNVAGYGLRFTNSSSRFPYHYYGDRRFSESSARAHSGHFFVAESIMYRDNARCTCYSGGAGAIFFDTQEFANATAWLQVQSYDENTGKYLPDGGKARLRAALLASKGG